MSAPSANRNEAFVELLTLHHRRMYGFIYTLVPNAADAEDLLQQTSLILWRKFDEFEAGSDFGAWACRIARYEALNFLKYKRRNRVHFSDELLAQLAEVRTSRGDVHATDRTLLPECIGQLTASDRRLIDLCYAGTRGIKAAAEELGRPLASVYVSLSRIRRVLLDCVRRAASQEDRS